MTLQERFAEVTIIDPTTNDIVGYVYLFENTETILPQDAGQKLVLYDFQLSNSDDYLNDYNFTCPGEFKVGPEGGYHECMDTVTNPEDSWIQTPHYSRHFAKNW